MKPELEHFFASMKSYFTDPTTGGVYKDFVAGHLDDILEKLFPLTKKTVAPARWSDLKRLFAATGPATHHEMNRAGQGFADFLARQPDLPAHVAPIARFEWTDFAVFASPTEAPTSVAKLTVNPTLSSLELPFKICAWARAGDVRPQIPEAGAELALLWRHPVELTTYFVPADDRALLVLKMALEDLSISHVTQQTGLPAGTVEALVRRFHADGMVHAP